MGVLISYVDVIIYHSTNGYGEREKQNAWTSLIDDKQCAMNYGKMSNSMTSNAHA